MLMSCRPVVTVRFNWSDISILTTVIIRCFGLYITYWSVSEITSVQNIRTRSQISLWQVCHFVRALPLTSGLSQLICQSGHVPSCLLSAPLIGMLAKSVCSDYTIALFKSFDPSKPLMFTDSAVRFFLFIQSASMHFIISAILFDISFFQINCY